MYLTPFGSRAESLQPSLQPLCENVFERARAIPAPRGDLSDWVELMELVEVLCPVWPPHEPLFRGEFKL